MASNPNLSRKTVILTATQPEGAGNSILGNAVHNFSTNYGVTGVGSPAFLAFDEINPLSIDFNVVDTAPVRASLTPQKNLIGRKLTNIRPKTMWMNSPGVDFPNLTDSDTDNLPPDSAFEDTPGLRTDTIASSGYSLLTNSGAAAAGAVSGQAPFFGPLLRACGLKQVNAWSSSVVYTPRSSGFELAEVWVFADEILHKALDCVGTFTLAGTAGEGIECQFDLQGTYTAPSTPTGPTSITYPSDAKELMANSSTTITSDGVGYMSRDDANTDRPIIRSFNFDAGVTVTERGDINSAEGLFGLFITDRSPTLDLVVEVENKLTSTASLPGFNPIVDMANANTHDITFFHGTTAHKKTKFEFPEAQLVDVQYADDSGIRTYNLSYALTSTADDGEYTITTGNPT